MGPMSQEGTSACHIFQCSQAHGWGVSSLQQNPGNSIGAPVHKAPKSGNLLSPVRGLKCTTLPRRTKRFHISALLPTSFSLLNCVLCSHAFIKPNSDECAHCWPGCSSETLP